MPKHRTLLTELANLQNQLVVNMQFFIGYLATHLRTDPLPDINPSVILNERDIVTQSFRGNKYERNQIVYLHLLREQFLTDLPALLLFILNEQEAYEQFPTLRDSELSNLFTSPEHLASLASGAFSDRNNLIIDFQIGPDFRYDLADFFKLHYKISLLIHWIQTADNIAVEQQTQIDECYRQLTASVNKIKIQLDSPTERIALFNDHKVTKALPLSTPENEDPAIRDADAIAATQAFLLEQGYIDAGPAQHTDQFTQAQRALQEARNGRLNFLLNTAAPERNRTSTETRLQKLSRFIWGAVFYDILSDILKKSIFAIQNIKINVLRIWRGGPAGKITKAFKNLIMMLVICNIVTISVFVLFLLLSPFLRPGKHILHNIDTYSRVKKIIMYPLVVVNFLLVAPAHLLLGLALWLAGGKAILLAWDKLYQVAILFNLYIGLAIIATLLTIRLCGFIRNCIWPRTTEELRAHQDAEDIQEFRYERLRGVEIFDTPRTQRLLNLGMNIAEYDEDHAIQTERANELERHHPSPIAPPRTMDRAGSEHQDVTAQNSVASAAP